MNIYADDNSSDEIVVGYELEKTDGVYAFPVKRVVRAEVIRYNGESYLRTNEIAALLGIEQKSQFSSNIKRKLGSGVIIKGKESKSFRTEKDTEKTVFITAKNLMVYLEGLRQNKNKTARDEIIKALHDI